MEETQDEPQSMPQSTPQQIAQAICDANGISEERFIHHNRDISEIELFMWDFPQIRALHFFPFLRVLSITQQTISVIEGLECLPSLQKLTISETQVSKIQGISSCVNLILLNLSHNRIQSMNGIGKLPLLEQLWLHENEIELIEGLHDLPKLRFLWLAGNKISTISTALNRNLALECLNIAGNMIHRFQDIQALVHLPNLKNLSFTHPSFGGNPICDLNNYQTYSIFHLKQLQLFDGIQIDPESRVAAETTYLRKRMYYNMKTKIIKRQIAATIQALEAEMKQQYSQVKDFLRPLQVQERELLFLKQVQNFGPEKCLRITTMNGEDLDDMVEEKADAIHSLIHQQARAWEEKKLFFSNRFVEVCGMREGLVRRLFVELETGGNIRIEEGSSRDPWFIACQDILTSRFHGGDFASLNIEGVRIKKAYRVHSRFLRQKFDAIIETITEQSENSYKKYVEYLLNPLDSGHMSEWINLLEDGLQSYVQGPDDGIPMHNSLCGLDLNRIHHLTLNERCSPRFLIMSRVLLTKVTGEGRSNRPSSSRSASNGNSNERSPYIKRDNYPGFVAVYRTLSGDSRQRLWYILDSDFAMPEYIIEYEYTVESTTGQTQTPDLAALMNDRPASMLSSRPSSEMRPRSALASAGSTRNLAVNTMKALKDDLANAPQSSDITTQKQYRTSILSMPPTFDFSNKLIVLSTDALQHSHGVDLATIQVLHFNNIQVCEIGSLANLTQLRVLVLSFNEITSISNIKNMSNLELLDLYSNSIETVDGLQGLPSLKILNLGANRISRMDEVNYLKKYVGEVRDIMLKENPIESADDYRSFVIRRFSNLEFLDGEPVTEDAKLEAKDASSSITSALIKENGYDQIRSTFFIQKSASVISSSKPSDAWWINIVEVDLSMKKIRKMQNFERLINLSKLDLSGNEITKIEGLDMCTLLTDLNLEGNKIPRIEGLGRLPRLARLELGNNLLTSLDGLSNKSLTQLAVDGNQIKSLQALAGHDLLLELYAGNNKIDNIKECLIIKSLSRLMILDLQGNPICSEATYRLFLIFHGKRLKIIDGSGIEESEVEEATSKLSGRLTIEVLMDKIGAAKLDQIQLLDVSNCGIREIEAWDRQHLKSLVELNLDKNFLEDLSGLVHVGNLGILRLCNNRLEAKGCSSTVKDSQTGWGFCNMQSLHHLYLASNQIASMSACQLSHLINLKVLDLQGNSISKIDGLEELQQLQELNLSKNKLRALDGQTLQQLPKLTRLCLDDNAIKVCSNMHFITNLTTLSITNNRIVDLADLENFEVCSIVDIHIAQNAVTRKPLFRVTFLRKAPHLLSIDGKTVTPEERERAENLTEASETSLAPNPEPAKPPPAGKVSIRVQSLSFDQMSNTPADFGRSDPKPAAPAKSSSKPVLVTRKTAR